MERHLKIAPVTRTQYRAPRLGDGIILDQQPWLAEVVTIVREWGR
jgi:hypothetical protein